MDATDVVIENSHDKSSTIMEEISGYREKESDRELFLQKLPSQLRKCIMNRNKNFGKYCLSVKCKFSGHFPVIQRR